MIILEVTLRRHVVVVIVLGRDVVALTGVVTLGGIPFWRSLARWYVVVIIRV